MNQSNESIQSTEMKQSNSIVQTTPIDLHEIKIILHIPTGELISTQIPHNENEKLKIIKSYLNQHAIPLIQSQTNNSFTIDQIHVLKWIPILNIDGKSSSKIIIKCVQLF